MSQNKEVLKAAALRQRIGELVSLYEDQMAELKAEATVIITEQGERIQALEAQVAEYGRDVDSVSEEADPDA